MSPELDEKYFHWLYSQVASVKLKNPARTFWSLLEILFQTEFEWFVPNDDNRVADCQRLRREFLEETGFKADAEWSEEGCSIFELLLGLARDLSFVADGDPDIWFWELVENLDLRRYDDLYFDPNKHSDIVETKLDIFVTRSYNYDGSGGVFPLKQPVDDQRDVELWYQLNAYVLERV